MWMGTTVLPLHREGKFALRQQYQWSAIDSVCNIKWIDELKRSRNTWYNDVCRISVDKRRIARDDFIKNNTQTTKEAFIQKRKICKIAFQREKRKFFNNILHTAEKDHTQGRTRNFFRVIKQYKQFNPIWNAIRD